MIKYNPATGDVEDDGADGSTLPIGAVTQAAAPITPVSAGAVTQASTLPTASVSTGPATGAASNSSSNPWAIDYNQFKAATDPFLNGNNYWSNRDGAATDKRPELQLANGKTWTPSGWQSGIWYHPKGEVTYETSFDGQGGEGGNQVSTPKINEEEYWEVAGDQSAMLGQPGSEKHAKVTYKRVGDQLVPTEDPLMRDYQTPYGTQNRGLLLFLAAAAGGAGLLEAGAGTATGAGGFGGYGVGAGNLATGLTAGGDALLGGTLAEGAGYGGLSGALGSGAAGAVSAAATTAAESTIMEQLATQFGKQFTVDALGKTALKNAAIQLATTGKVDLGRLATSTLVSPIANTVGATVTSGMDPGMLRDAASGALTSGTNAALTGGNVINSALAGGVIGAANPLFSSAKDAGKSAWDSLKSKLGFGDTSSAAIADANQYWTDNRLYRDGSQEPEMFGANDRQPFVNSNDTDGGVDGAVPLEIDHRGYIFDPASGDPVGYQFPDGRTQWVTMDGDGNVTSGKLGGVMDDSTGVISYPDGTVESPQSVDFSTSGNPTTVNGAITYADSNDARGISTDDTGVVALPNGTVVNPDGTVVNKKPDAAGNTTNTTNTTNITSISPAKQREMYADTAPPVDWSAFYAAYKALVENNKRAS